MGIALTTQTPNLDGERNEGVTTSGGRGGAGPETGVHCKFNQGKKKDKCN